MGELTAEVVREIVREEIQGVRGELDGLRSEMQTELASLREQMMDGFDQILETAQAFLEETRDESTGVKARLQNHNERLAKLERLQGLR